VPQRASAVLLGQLLAENGPALALYAANWTAAAEDCVQEALVELAGLPRLPDSPVAWLNARVRQRALNAARAERRRTGHESAAWRDRLIATSTDPVEALDLVTALAELSSEDRELVTLRFYSDLTYDEIAAAVGSSKSAVHRRTENALTQLRTRLEAPCDPNPTPPKNNSSSVSVRR
jgi:RNA polymerase sigma-70 factor (ECF subfamily)